MDAGAGTTTAAELLAGGHRPGHFGLTVQDFEGPQTIVPGEAVVLAPARRGRGRPRKSLGTALVQSAADQAAPTLAEMAFLRAQLQGVSAEAAADRYLGLEEKVDARSLKAFARRLMVRIVERARVLGDSDEALARVVELDALLPEEVAPVASAPAVPAAAEGPAGPVLPTLEKFAAERGAEDFSVDELCAMYQDEFGVDPMAGPKPAPAAVPVPVSVPTAETPAAAPAKVREQAIVRKLDALAWLVPRMARAPLPDALVGEWFKPEVTVVLKAQGVKTLAEMVAWINRRGRRWFDEVPGLGRARAHRVVAWLWAHAEHLQVRPDARILQGLAFPTIPLVGADAWRARGEGRGEVVTPAGTFDITRPKGKRFGIVPMEVFAWPQEFLGAAGPFRTTKPNHLEADNDPQAVSHWLSTVIGHNKSDNTLRLYRIAVERLILWALVERRPAPRALADLVPADLQAFGQFLAEPPPTWIQPNPTPRRSPDWRPLRGPLDPATIRQTLAAVQSMYKAWWSLGYLTGDPTQQLAMPTGGRPQIDVMRSFGRQDIEAIERTYAELPEGPAKNRLQAIILLVQGAGVRAAEPTAGNWGDITSLRLAGETSDQFQLRVIGKGGKVRLIPLRADAVAALRLHYEDRVRLADAGAVPPLVDREVEGVYAQRYGWPDAEAFADSAVELPVRPDGLPPASVPLLGVLRRGRMPAERTADSWGMVAGSPEAERKAAADARKARAVGEGSQDRQGRLSVDSLYGDLKAFFRRVAERDDLEAGAANFRKASAHWLRHTFAHQVLASVEGDVGLAVAQQLLGHASVATTGIYTKADMGQRTEAVNAMPGWRLGVEVQERSEPPADEGGALRDDLVRAAHVALDPDARELPWTSNCAGEVFIVDPTGTEVRIGDFSGNASLASFVVAAHTQMLSLRGSGRREFE